MSSRFLSCLNNSISYVRAYSGLIIVLTCLTIIKFACAPSTQPQLSDLQASNTEAPSSYTFIPGDQIEVIVWKNPDLSRVVAVRSDGNISLPLIGDVHAAGFTTSELADAITQELLAYYKDAPVVSIIVNQATNAAVFVLGEVASQGRYEVANGTTLLQVIALAGGFSEFASRNKIIIRRKGRGGEEITFNFRYKDILEGREKNVIVQHEDTVIVQ